MRDEIEEKIINRRIRRKKLDIPYDPRPHHPLKFNNILGISPIALKVIFILIIISIIGGFILAVYTSQNYYKGIWKLHITELEKSTLKKLEFNIQESTITQDSISENDGIKVSTTIVFSIKIFNKMNSGIYFRTENIELSNLDISLQSEICSKDPNQCELAKNDIKNQVKTNLEERKVIYFSDQIILRNRKNGINLSLPGTETYDLIR